MTDTNAADQIPSSPSSAHNSVKPNQNKTVKKADYTVLPRSHALAACKVRNLARTCQKM